MIWDPVFVLGMFVLFVTFYLGKRVINSKERVFYFWVVFSFTLLLVTIMLQLSKIVHILSLLQ